MIKRPKSIAPGSVIGITAPSFGAATEPYSYLIDVAIENITRRGYKILEGKTARLGDGIGISTDPKVAACELTEFYKRGDIDAIISAGGGELMNETITYVDFEELKSAEPKWFVGYSDNTNFIFPLVTITGVQGIYGPCISGYGKVWEQTEEDAFALLEGTKDCFSGYDMFVKEPEKADECEEGNSQDSSDEEPEEDLFSKPREEIFKVLREYRYELNEKKVLTSFSCESGKAVKLSDTDKVNVSGILLGGCLEVLENLVGTRFDRVKEFKKDNKDIIWVLEKCEMNPMSYRRSLWNLREAGWFDGAAGFIIGRPGNFFDGDMMGVDRFNAVTDILAPIGAPIIMDADIGHVNPMLPIIMGADADVTAIGNDLNIRYL
ncbi:LD-carboxypeptidase [Butyrivibrio sp. X503]|uniref:S66 family peptidase n=1 Tax=Butyrivibrio sp. X503 TaxID=2364878 RepID=UPI000EA8AA07|nr:S66 peptidase family protein [Butyrivibrio sp. X503]RKM57279.1 LD-carboxypeptidase [Butyrivibrio sp. X503]